MRQWLIQVVCLTISLCLKFVLAIEYHPLLAFSEVDLERSKKSAIIENIKRRTADSQARYILRVAREQIEIAAERIQSLQRPTEFSREDDRKGDFLVNFAKKLCKIKACQDENKRDIYRIKVPDKLNFLCRPYLECNEFTKKYRTIDGTCNNLDQSWLGAALTPQERFIPSAYDDLLQVPRVKSVTGYPLPSPRKISSTIVKGESNKAFGITTFFVFFGQLVDHDLALTPFVTANGSDIICCGNERTVAEISKSCIRLDHRRKRPRLTCMKPHSNRLQPPVIRRIDSSRYLCCPDELGKLKIHPACLPIDIPQDDPFFSKYDQRCMEFVRSSTIVNHKCVLGAREQSNQVTAFLDASFLYGSDDKHASEIRQFNNGLMKTSGKSLLPRERDCIAQECEFIGGDERVNEIPPLTMWHTIFMREHNRIAKIIKRNRETWSDDSVYHEARKIVIGIYQNIIFREFLPMIIGPDLMEEYNLKPSNKSDPNLYRVFVRPAIRNAFAAAAFRFGHTLLPNTLKFDFNKKVTMNPLLHFKFFTPDDLLNKTKLTALARGLLRQDAEGFDTFLTLSVTRHLLQDHGEKFGLDLASLNIQRGRDHGIPPYNEYRKFCKLEKLKSFAEINGSNSCCFSSIYKHVDDIDLFVGGLSEKPVKGGIVGETFACLIAKQFQVLMRGDRFFYTNGKTSEKQAGHGYTSEQLEEFNKGNVARIICENLAIEKIQVFPFLRANRKLNPVVNCQEIKGPMITKLIPETSDVDSLHPPGHKEESKTVEINAQISKINDAIDGVIDKELNKFRSQSATLDNLNQLLPGVGTRISEIIKNRIRGKRSVEPESSYQKYLKSKRERLDHSQHQHGQASWKNPLKYKHRGAGIKVEDDHEAEFEANIDSLHAFDGDDEESFEKQYLKLMHKHFHDIHGPHPNKRSYGVADEDDPDGEYDHEIEDDIDYSENGNQEKGSHSSHLVEDEPDEVHIEDEEYDQYEDENSQWRDDNEFRTKYDRH